jgi:hypothetical protein
VPPASQFLPADRSLIALGAIVLGFALQINNGFYHPAALALLGLAAVSIAGGLARIGSRVAGPGRPSVVRGILVAGLAADLVALATMKPEYFLIHARPIEHPQLMAGLVAAAIVVTLMAADGRRCRRLWFPLLLIVYLYLGDWLIRAWPNPKVDVVTVQRVAIEALLHGASPYSITFPNIYGTTDLYPPGLADVRTVYFGLPYPPLSLLMALPGQVLLGDLRYAELAALVAGAGAIGLSARGRIAPFAAAMLLFTPRTLYVLEQGWTEAFAICWLGFSIHSAVRRSHQGWLPLGLFLAAKQHMVLALPLTPWLAQPGGTPHDVRRLVLGAIAVAGVVTIPFLLWDPSGFWRSVVWLQFQERFRVDSLSVLVCLARWGWPISNTTLMIAPIAALCIGLAVVFRWAPRSPSGFAVGLGFVFLLLFAVSKKAFCNYYFFALALLAAGTAAGSDDPES